MMGRWSKNLLLILAFPLIVLTGASANNSEPLPDLSVRDLTLSPAGSIDLGDIVRAEAVVARVGGPLADVVQVEISWRRIDQEGMCGSIVETAFLGEPDETEQPIAVQIDTSDLTVGDYEVAARVDPGNRVEESDETNNRVTTTLRIDPPRPELHPVTLEMDPSSPLLWGETGTVSTVVENTGSAAAGAFHVRFLLFPIYCQHPTTGEAWGISATDSGEWVFTLDSDGSLNPSVRTLVDLTSSLPSGAWIPFAAAQVAGLERDQSKEISDALWTGQPLRETLTTAVASPGGGSAGPGRIASSMMLPLDGGVQMKRLEECVTTYAIHVIVEDPEGTPEEDTTNNQLQGTMTVRPSTLELPELLPVRVEFDDDMPLDWDDYTDVQVLITNRGGSAAPLLRTATPGTTNTGIDVSFYYRAFGETVWKFLEKETISRLGVEEDSSSEIVETRIDARSSQLNLTPGSYELRVVVDEPKDGGEVGAIPEQNENNNELIVGFSVQGIELHPISLDIPSGPIRQGDTVAVVALVENTQDLSLRDFTVGFFLDDARFDTFYYRAADETEEGLEEGDRARAEGVLDTTDLSPETYTLRVVVDPDNRIPEIDESNNVIRASIRILPPAERLAELHPTEIGLEPPSPVGAGDLLTIAATVRNTGRIDAGRFQVQYSLSGNADGGDWAQQDSPCCGAQLPGNSESLLCRCTSVSGLAKSAKLVIRETFSTSDWPEGQYQLSVRVDPPLAGEEAGEAGEIPELDEKNNTMIISFSIGEPKGGSGPILPKPNLTCVLSASPPANIEVGESVQVRGAVANASSVAAGPFRMRVQLRDPSGGLVTVRETDIGGLEGGGTYNLSSTTIHLPVPGAYQLIGTADWRDDVEEHDESDNTCTQVIVAGGVPANLVPVSVRFAPPCSPPCTPHGAQVEVGQDLFVYVGVQNQGALACGAFAVAFITPERTDYEHSAGLGPLEQVEMAHRLDTSDAGEFTLTIQVDPEDLIDEASKADNTIVGSYQVQAPEEIRAVGLVGDDSPVRFLTRDGVTDTLYAVWGDGKIRAIEGADSGRLLLDAGDQITAFAADMGTVSVAFVGTSSGQVHRIDLLSETVTAMSLTSSGEVRALEPGGSGNLFAATDKTLYLLDRELVVIGQVDVVGSLTDIGYDEQRETLYAISSGGLYAYDLDLSLLCEGTSLVGTPTALAVGSGGVYVGTDAGVVCAHSFCMAHSGVPQPMMVEGWTYPRFGQPGTRINAIVVNPGGLDPIYATTDEGTLYVINYTGALLWTFPDAQDQTIGPVRSTPVIEPRSGRVFFGDDDGVPYILESHGELAFEVDISGTNGEAIRSSLAVGETRRQTETGTRLIRSYYYGAQDGWVYKIDSQR
jgi:hypothetical protein